MKSIGVAAVVVGLVVGAAQGAVAFEPADSPRLARAKDLISEERWTAAIPELRAAVNDRKEQNKDEVLFWLAHSQNQAGDLAEAVESIRKLQATYPKSRWKQPAGSLMIELAQKLGRRDLLWLTAVPPAPPVGPSAPPRRRDARAARVTARAAGCGRPPGTAGARCAHTAGAARTAGAADGGDLVRRSLSAGHGPSRPGARPADSHRCAQGDPDPAQHRARGGQSRRRAPRGLHPRAVAQSAGAIHGRRRGESGVGDRSGGGRARARALRWSERRPGSARGVLARQRAGEAAGGLLARRARRHLSPFPHRPDRERRRAA